MNKRHYEHTLPNIRGSLSNTYIASQSTKGGGSESLPIKDKVCGIKGVAGGTRGRFRYNRVWPWQTGR